MTERQSAEGKREPTPEAQCAPVSKETKPRERSDRGLRNVDTGTERTAPQAPKERDRPWLMRTYAGHSTAEASNELYRRNLAKGQTGLSVAFDLPTQTGYDSDHILARGEVGRVGVPIAHLGDMRRLFQDIPLEQMNTSMTINATAMWLLALYQVVAEEQGADITQLQGTTQNDIVKEYLSRGTHVFPPGPSLRLTTDMIAYTVSHIPKWNPINICSYHLQEAGATPVQEIAYAMSTAIAVLDAVRDSGQVPQERMGDVVGRISFFVNAGVRFIEEMCKMRAFGRIWDKVTRERYGIENPKHRRFRYGVQVNSLGLTEAQPENNVQRIVLEMLAVTLSKDARARAVQLPAWNEALGLPRPWDQQWSLRMQQVLAYESDLLEYADIFEGSHVVEAKVSTLVEESLAEIERIQEMGGAMAAVESGYLKSQLVSSHAERRARIESGQEKIIGVNIFETTEPNPLTADLDTAIQTVDPAVESRVVQALHEWRRNADKVGLSDNGVEGPTAGQAESDACGGLCKTAPFGDRQRPVKQEPEVVPSRGTDQNRLPSGERGRQQPPFNHSRRCKALGRLREAAATDANLMEATLECARAGVTTGEWAGALREVFGEFRAPTGVSSAPVAVPAEEGSAMADVRRRVDLTAKDLGVGKLRFLVGKPGLDGHSNGAEQIAVRARDAGFEVVYQGIRLTPEQIVDAALAEDVHAVGLSILSGSHAQLVPDVLERLHVAGATDVPVIAGGIIPNGDAEQLRAAGVAAVFTPKDFDITGIIGRIVDEIRKANKLDPLEVPA
ncbi:protein meaA [Streptomyces canus]|uniref:protein meaA n=1 Tax=Streptomyces canus TaxID=58343 RepID=UPI0022534F55|nr:protein meaA [Streptomyces canus]